MSRVLFALALLVSALPLAAQPSAPRCQSVRSQDPDTRAIVQKTHLAPSADGSTDPLLVWTSDDPRFADARGDPHARGAEVRRLLRHDPPGRRQAGATLTRVRHRQGPQQQRGTVLEYVRAEIPWAEVQKLAAGQDDHLQDLRRPPPGREEFVCEARHVVEVATRWRREQAEKR